MQKESINDKLKVRGRAERGWWKAIRWWL